MRNNSKPTKRSFDVAFLIKPDEKLVHKQENQIKFCKESIIGEESYAQVMVESHGFNFTKTSNPQYIETHSTKHELQSYNENPVNLSEDNINTETDEKFSKIYFTSDSDTSDTSRGRPNLNDSAEIHKYIPKEFKSEVFDTSSSVTACATFMKQSDMLQNLGTNFMNTTPRLSMKPNFFQNSADPQINTSYSELYSHNFYKSYGFDNLLSTNLFNRSVFSSEKQIQSSKLNLSDVSLYSPKASCPFSNQNFQLRNPDILKMETPVRETAKPGNPAAAILSALLPPTLAAFSLPAQNMCAICNISFRMTSDLVYHMRTHHKFETAVGTTRRIREDKLKCSVCDESFREKHHLTRHMTAHQDKEGDDTSKRSKK